MHSAAAFSYETSRRGEYGVRRPDVLVPSGHPGLDGQDSLVLHNALSNVDDNQVGLPFLVGPYNVKLKRPQ
jgi:hypothetical protein